MKKAFLLLIFSTQILLAQPQAPKNLQGEIIQGERIQSVKLTWQPSESARGYFIYKKELNEFHKRYHRIPALKNYFEDKVVFPGRNYLYFVTAFNKMGESLPSDTIRISLDETTESAFLEGVVKDEETGLVLDRGDVFLFPLSGLHHYRFKIDSSGHYQKEIVPGKYILSFSTRGYITEFYENAYSIFNATPLTIAESETLKIDAELKPVEKPEKFTLSGKVTNSLGEPLKAAISVLTLNHSFFRKDVFNAVTDSSGNYKLKVRESDSVIVYAVPLHKEYLPEFFDNKNDFSEADRLIINGNVENIDFVLSEKPVFDNSVSGQIKNLDGEGIQGSLTLFKLRENKHAKYKRSILSDSSGSFSFTNISPGKYVLLCIPTEGYLPTFFKYDSTNTIKWKEADSIEVTETSIINGINITVAPVLDGGIGMIAGKTGDNSGTGIGGVIITALNENSEIAASAISDDEGIFEIANLLPGTYTIVADKFSFSGSAKESVVVDYQANLKNDVQLSLSPLSTTSVKTDKQKITGYKLDQNYPNPFNPVTNITYHIPNAGLVTIKIFNVIGQEISTVVNEFMQPGIYNVKFDGTNLNSGIYFYKLQAGSNIITRKMILLK